jgi:hypothetical protein
LPAQDIATLSAVPHRSSMTHLWRAFFTAAHKHCPKGKIKVKARGPASDIDWFRSGLNGKLTSRAWSARRLRFLAPRLWLGEELAGAIDANRLNPIADISKSGSTLRIALARRRRPRRPGGYLGTHFPQGVPPSV